jgi:hypothetical protein
MIFITCVRVLICHFRKAKLITMYKTFFLILFLIPNLINAQLFIGQIKEQSKYVPNDYFKIKGLNL